MSRLILASQSPRRLALLAQIGYAPDLVVPADLDESIHKKELPKAYAMRIAREKALKIAAEYPDDIVLAGDTSVVLGRMILGKAADAAEATQMLKKLQGRRHKVIGSIAVAHKGKVRVKAVTTLVKFAPLSPTEIQTYVDSGEWQDKAGAYSIQGYAGSFCAYISGSYTNIVGLCVHETRKLLRGCV